MCHTENVRKSLAMEFMYNTIQLRFYWIHTLRCELFYSSNLIRRINYVRMCLHRAFVWWCRALGVRIMKYANSTSETDNYDMMEMLRVVFVNTLNRWVACSKIKYRSFCIKLEPERLEMDFGNFVSPLSLSRNINNLSLFCLHAKTNFRPCAVRAEKKRHWNCFTKLHRQSSITVHVKNSICPNKYVSPPHCIRSILYRKIGICCAWASFSHHPHRRTGWLHYALNFVK